MKKIICAILSIVCVFSLFACTNSNTADVDIHAVKEQIIADLKVEGAMDLGSERLLALYGIEEADIADSACYVTMDGVFPNEIIMIKAVDSAAADRVAEKLELRLDEIKVQSQSYDPENYALAQECSVKRAGNTVALFISPEHSEMENIFAPESK